MHRIKSFPREIGAKFNHQSTHTDLKPADKLSTTGQLANNQQGFTLFEFTMSVFLLTVAMLGLARWQHQALLQHHWLSQQLQAWMLAEHVIEQLADGKTVNKQSAPGFQIKYTIHWQGRCRLIKVQIDGRQQSTAQLKLFVC